MLTVLWSPKGGVGVSVVAAALAVAKAAEPAPDPPPDRDPSHPFGAHVLLVDTCGDLPSVLGIARPT